MGSFGLIYMKLSYISKICKDLEFFPRWFCTPLIPRNWYFYSRCVSNSKNNYFQTASTHFLVKLPKIATTTKTLFISFALLSRPLFLSNLPTFPLPSSQYRMRQNRRGGQGCSWRIHRCMKAFPTR